MKGSWAGTVLAKRSRQSIFEALIADLATRLADVSAGEVVAEIERALARMLSFFGYDRGTYSEFTPEGVLEVLASAAAGGLEPWPPGPLDQAFAWLPAELRAGRIVSLPSVADSLPAEAGAERDYCARLGVRSHLSIPLYSRGRVAGALSFVGLRRARRWSAEAITRVTIVGELLAGALARARSEYEAQRLRTRLWHADRVARIGALTAAIAHEINQPLTAILSNAQAALANLERGELQQEAIREILEAVVRDDKRAAETIRTMRTFLRKEEGGRGRIDLAASLRDVLRLLAAELDRHGIRVESRLEPGCWVKADKTQIEQVALNLLLNAAAAMEQSPPGERVLGLSARRRHDGRVAVAVRDAGSGIATENIASVFEPFWTTRKDGLGLGLAICRSIIDAHGGAISVRANAERGVTFHFDLPGETCLAEPRPAEQAVNAQAPALPETGGPVVCLIDDDPAVREGLARLLASQGWGVASYASAGEFLDRPVTAADIGCILLDNRMPGMSGRELQAHLAARGMTPPVIFLSGQSDVSTSVDAMKLGAMDFLLKPVDAGVLVAAVAKALARQAEQRSRALDHEGYLARLARLSVRERQVMNEVVRGRLNKQIAADLDIALQTVKQHRARVMDKMGASSVAELVQVCAALGNMPGQGSSPQ